MGERCNYPVNTFMVTLNFIVDIVTAYVRFPCKGMVNKYFNLCTRRKEIEE